MTTVYSNPIFGNPNIVLATCSTGTESAPTTDATAGLSMLGLLGYQIKLKATAGTFSASVLNCYAWNSVEGYWYPDPDEDLVVVAGLARQAWATVPVMAQKGRRTYVPNGVGVACVVYLVGSPV